MVARKTFLGLVVVLIQTTVITFAAPSTPSATTPLQGLVKRLLPRSYHNAFDFQLVSDIPAPTADNKYDVYRVSNKNDSESGSSILIEGTTLSALGAGLKFYLDQAGQVELTWSGNRFKDLPRVPPQVPDQELDTGKVVTTGHIRGSIVPLRYYTNVVSFGYQFVFWDWKRWERELDWMLLNGINMLPAMVGQEYVVREFYYSLNLTDADMDSFLTGPAYMPWQRMGNLQGSWNHELLHSSAQNEMIYKKEWINGQWALQKLILARLEAFDIKAVLPAFQSFVPRALVHKFPNNIFKNATDWSFFPVEYTNVTYVEPTDPLFTQLSTKYLDLQQKLYNGYTSHYYLLDLYNELSPDCATPECLKAITTSVTKALLSVDSKAVWVMQGWFLQNTDIWTPEATKAYFAGIRAADGDPFIFDLASDSLPVWDTNEGFYGYDFGWSLINNYGAAQGLFGKLTDLFTLPFKAYSQYSGNLKGLGVTAEGINNNEYVYHTLLDLAWKDPKATIDQAKHLELFIRRRYGAALATDSVQDAWSKFSKTVWDCRSRQPSQSKSFIEKFPSLNMTDSGWLGTVFWYDQTTVVQAWNQLVQAAAGAAKSHTKIPDTLKFDLVDTTREVLLATVFPAIQEALVESYQAYDVKKVQTYGRQLVQLVQDADRLLNTHEFFSFGAWVNDAKASIDPIHPGSSSFLLESTSSSKGPTKAGYLQFLESNARNIVTWWGPAGSGPPGSLPDYASKQWGGLINSYYLPRWQLFIKSLEQAAAAKKPWDGDDFANKVLEFETVWQAQTWGHQKGESTADVNGQDPVSVVRELNAKYGALAAKIAAGGKP